MHSHHKTISIITITILLQLHQAVPIINNQPINLQMNGVISYSPDAGGAQQVGYNLTIGFTSYSWLGVLFMSATPKQDFLVVSINDFYTDNGG
jgi:hypothetical protein